MATLNLQSALDGISETALALFGSFELRTYGLVYSAVVGSEGDLSANGLKLTLCSPTGAPDIARVRGL